MRQGARGQGAPARGGGLQQRQQRRRPWVLAWSWCPIVAAARVQKQQWSEAVKCNIVEKPEMDGAGSKQYMAGATAGEQQRRPWLAESPTAGARSTRGDGTGRARQEVGLGVGQRGCGLLVGGGRAARGASAEAGPAATEEGGATGLQQSSGSRAALQGAKGRLLHREAGVRCGAEQRCSASMAGRCGGGRRHGGAA